METTILLRRDSSTNWINANPVLGVGEPAYEIDTGRIKLGDGLSSWTDLPYFSPGAGADPSNATLFDHVLSLTPHPVYDDGPSLSLLYENAKV